MKNPFPSHKKSYKADGNAFILCYNTSMTNFKERLLIYFTAISAGVLLISNLSAVKLWNLFGIAVDGGVVVFPLTYIVGDLIVEFYGKKVARHIIVAGFLVNIIAMVSFSIVIALPAYPGWDMQEAYARVLGFAPRIIIGSLTAYVCANLFNNYIFTRLKNGSGIFAASFIARALGSSAFAHIADTLIFETIAFFGVLPWTQFLMQAGFAYVLGIGFEVVLAPFEAWIANVLGGKIKYDNI